MRMNGDLISVARFRRVTGVKIKKPTVSSGFIEGNLTWNIKLILKWKSRIRLQVMLRIALTSSMRWATFLN